MRAGARSSPPPGWVASPSRAAPTSPSPRSPESCPACGIGVRARREAAPPACPTLASLEWPEDPQRLPPPETPRRIPVRAAGGRLGSPATAEERGRRSWCRRCIFNGKMAISAQTCGAARLVPALCSPVILCLVLSAPVADGFSFPQQYT